jgi:hypothetical protein
VASERIPNEVITAAERVLRHLQDGREPYAPSVMPMARALVELARDPAFILPAAEAMLREAGATTLELLYWDRGASDCLALRDRHHKREAHAPAGGLADAVSRLATSRKSAGEEGG